MAGVTHPAPLLLVVAAAGLAGVQLAVQTLPLAVHQELEGLQAADAEGVRQAGLGAHQDLSLGVLLLYLGLQVAGREGRGDVQ